MSSSLQLGFYSLQIETEPRGALLKPLTQHMAGRRDWPEQRRRVRDADEPGHGAGPPGTGSDPHPTAPGLGHRPQALPALLPCALPGVGLGWGHVPALAALPLPTGSAACSRGVGRFPHPFLGSGRKDTSPLALPARAEQFYPKSGVAHFRLGTQQPWTP